MRVMTIAAGLALLAGPAPALAQELPDFITDPTPPAPAAETSRRGDAQADDAEASQAGDGGALSELERLSRLEDDPFAGVLEREAREPVSVTLRALDKVTASYTDIEIGMNEIARFGSLELQPRTCDKRPPEEFPETTAFLEIFDTKSDSASNWKREDLNTPAAEDGQEAGNAAGEADSYDPMLTAPDALPASRFGADASESEEDLQAEFIAALEAGFDAAPQGGPAQDDGASEEGVLAAEAAPEVLEGPQAEGENIFRGWMFASSPALNALEHPVYDVWVIDCKTRVASN